ncbi:type VI secretion system-associated FHA domain protein TagH [Thalassomonas actiniarum]|uniref:Type VI secretion system-associated FHA domain protein TagH n=1 Tax=Thalassomonas actiniarum TaxID=485447 RepID=A0AAE9YVM5_9GAMM|nr:type VI secretion system-associated FHA domain protein TagH [Thalassomonas actiniarum]WDE01174.1 type VI secretion system-associated FHA domain protein TagH [Thalassomonas actiniarum]
MELEFEIVSYHRLSPEQVTKKRVRDGITFGRSEKNDWHLPDPEKVVSGTHARIERQGQGFVIYDLSTNGLYINRAVEALGKDKAYLLCDGDLLAFGDYEISVSLLEQAFESSFEKGTVSQAETPVPPPVTPVGSGIAVGSVFGETLATNEHELPKSQLALPEVQTELDDHFSLPQAAIPKEWELELLGKTAPAQEQEPGGGHFSTAEQPIAAAEPVSTIMANDTGQVAAKAETATAVKANNKKNHTASSPAGLQAFVKGLGISPQVLPQELSDELLYQMGQAMQLLLAGLMDSLRSRASLKHEFRVNQTTFQQQENNPLKFSASVDDVFENLFLRSSKSFLSSKRAISEAFDDIRKHDIALTAGTVGAIEGVLSQLDPEVIASRDFRPSPLDKIVPGQKQLRYWKIYQSLHQDLVQEQAGQGGVLSDDFIRAYDKKIKSL